jgi:hypothetical protein
MRRFETPYVADWLAASIRWIVLVGSYCSYPQRSDSVHAPWPLNSYFCLEYVHEPLAVFSIRAINYHRQIVLVIDFCSPPSFLVTR